MNDWNIQSRAHHCQGCEKPFVDQQPYHTLLFDDRTEYKRQDVCEKCWDDKFREQSLGQPSFLFYWQGVYHKPPAAAPEAIQKDTAESLLRKLIELNDPKYTAASYILAVMLERKRLLKIKEQFTRDGTRVFVYEQPKTGDLFTIPDPNLQLNQLDEVQRDVAQLLQHGLPGEAPAGDAAPESNSNEASSQGEAASGQGEPASDETRASEPVVPESRPLPNEVI